MRFEAAFVEVADQVRERRGRATELAPVVHEEDWCARMPGHLERPRGRPSMVTASPVVTRRAVAGWIAAIEAEDIVSAA